MKAYTFTQDELTEKYNDAIDAYTMQLRDANVLSQETYEELSQYRIVVATPNVFGRFWARMFRSSWNESEAYYHLVKIIAPRKLKVEGDGK